MPITGVVFEELERVNKRYIIDIRTLRDANDEGYSEFFPDEWNVRGYLSKINFSNPLIDSNEEKNIGLTLSTIWYLPNSPCWKICLSNEEGFALDVKYFGRLDKSFLDYSEKKLINWQKQGLSAHKEALSKLEDLFYQDKELSKNFFSFIKD